MPLSDAGSDVRFDPAVLDAFAAPVAAIDATGVIVATNQAWRVFAAEAEPGWHAAGEGDDYVALTHDAAELGDDDAMRMLAGIELALRGAAHTFATLHPVRAGGRDRWFRCRVSGLDPGGAALPLVIVSLEDITDVSEARVRFNDLFEHLADAMVLVDDRGIVRLANARAEHLFGWTRGELVGKAVRELIPTEAHGAHDAHVAGYFADPAPRMMSGRSVNLEACRRDGTRLPVEISLTPLSWNGRPLVAAAVRDQTGRRALQRRAQQAQRLASLGILAGGIAHDLNNALSPITMVVGTLLAEEGGQQPHLDVVDASVRRAVDIIQQLRSLAQGAEGPRLALDPATVVRGMARVLRATLPAPIQLLVEVPDQLPRILGRAAELHQALLSLTANAEEAMPEGGRLTLRGQLWEVHTPPAGVHGSLRPGPYVRLTVADTGVGMVPEVRARAAEPYFTTREVGAGLGLASAVEIAIGHEGALAITSAPGRGTEVDLYLPVPSPGGPHRDPARHTIQIMVVHGDPVEGARLGDFLEASGYTVALAERGVQALTAVLEAGRSPDLILTCEHPPDMAAVDLVRTLGSARPALPVVVLAASDAAATLRAAGAAAVVEGRPTASALVAVVQAALSETGQVRS